MMKNRESLAAVIVLICVAAFIIAGAMLFRNGSKNAYKYARTSENVIYDQGFSEISSINIKQDAGNIRFEYGDGFRVVAKGKSSNYFNVNESGGALYIESNVKSRFNFFGINTTKNEVTVYLPANYTGEIMVDSDYGNCIAEDFANAVISINCDAGNVEFGSVQNAVINCDYGDIKIKEILNMCEIKSDVGNIEIESLDLKENSQIKSDVGNIKISKTNPIRINAKTDIGNVNIKGEDAGSLITLEVKCDVGNVDIG